MLMGAAVFCVLPSEPGGESADGSCCGCGCGGWEVAAVAVAAAAGGSSTAFKGTTGIGTGTANGASGGAAGGGPGGGGSSAGAAAVALPAVVALVLLHLRCAQTNPSCTMYLRCKHWTHTSRDTATRTAAESVRLACVCLCASTNQLLFTACCGYQVESFPPVCWFMNNPPFLEAPLT